MTTEAVYKFLREQNRPYSANDISQNIGKDHGKGSIQKSLDGLVEKERVMEKVYGKQKVYCVVQEDPGNPNEMATEMRQIDQQITDMVEQLKSGEEKLRTNENELKASQGKMSMAQAKIERDKLKEEILKLESKVDEFKAKEVDVISDEDKNKIKSEHEKYLKEYRKRKRICMDIINSILEGYPKTKKHLFEDIGIETDEDVGFQLEQ